MSLTRRYLLIWGGGAAVSLLAASARAAAVVEIGMQGSANGSHVWFDPIGLLIAPGTILRWVNGDPGNVHTSTAYADRLPPGAEPWDSGYLLPGQSFEATLTIPGVYDYYCLPHEHAGMVGRIVVGDAGSDYSDYPRGELPHAVQFPAIADILANGAVRRAR